MKTIYKYPAHFYGHFDLEMPKGAQILTIDTQEEAPYIWAIVDTNAPKEMRKFNMMKTGYPIPKEETLNYIGTFQECRPDVEFVGHLFEITN